MIFQTVAISQLWLTSTQVVSAFCESDTGLIFLGAPEVLHQTNLINQSGALLLSVGSHDPPRISIPCRFQCIYHLSYI